MVENQNFNEDERCDDEKTVFNVRLKESEMIITIEEYKKMKDEIERLTNRDMDNKGHITFLERKLKENSEESKNLLNEMNFINEENRKLKKGIINFIKGLGG